ncbi:hypothetical protein HOY34_08195 [Xinfangfangia sp. D13-10-4-6]|uniref:2-dehydro-3-deoxygalactonokinase n=1 Tax=Pseudogemmobacter hezensis TaxID=2737662 RepID=UPI0015567613|nr:2-dehydro-3-deoxygalactonokinase [Pseudogemmobacter hezensis]NPD15179.1 hypothetical protein [Pseudogemmobacter hezensis]
MATGWVIAHPDGAGWLCQIIAASGETEVVAGLSPAQAASLLTDGPRIGLVLGHDEAPLVALPCDPVAALRGAVAVDDGAAWRVLPRFSQESPLMLSAGEEVLLVGALSIAPKFDGAMLIRGQARALWAQISAGEVVSILGSIAPDLRRQLAPQLPPGVVVADAAFLQALAETLSRPERLSAHLAALPALRRLRGADEGQIRASVAGWLLGAELAAARPWWLGQQVLLITDQDDGASAALKEQGITPHHLPMQAALMAGLQAIAPLNAA